MSTTTTTDTDTTVNPSTTGRFAGLHAVVTGGTSGIGRATAERLADEGATVVVTGRDAARLADVGANQRVTAVGNDAGGADAGEALRAAADEHLDGRIDALFLNAGLGGFAPVPEIDADGFDSQFRVNVRGPLLQLAALDSALVDGAAVVFNTSVVNDLGMPTSAVYSATKGAVRSAMEVAANEYAARSIRVNAVSPGPIDTGFFAATGLSDAEIEGFAEQILTQVPLGRFGQPAEIAAAVAFLLSSDASYITGTELIVDGGMR